jgi:hypothetical protein
MSNILNRHQRRTLLSRRNEPKTQALIDLLRKEGSRLDDHTYLTELESENERLSKTLRATIDGLVPEIAALPEKFEAAREAEDLAHRVAALEALRPDIERLPCSLVDVLDLAARLYEDRIFIADEARKSARASGFTDLNTAWRALRAIAIHLHEVYGTGCDIEAEFRNLSGFEVALSESSATKADRDLYRQRMRKVGSRFVYSGGHVKIGHRPPQLLRIHYVYPPEAKTIEIWHCGDHLETAGSKRGRGK